METSSLQASAEVYSCTCLHSESRLKNMQTHKVDPAKEIAHQQSVTTISNEVNKPSPYDLV